MKISNVYNNYMIKSFYLSARNNKSFHAGENYLPIKNTEKQYEAISFGNGNYNILPNNKLSREKLIHQFIFNTKNINDKKIDDILSSQEMDDYIEKKPKAGIELTFSREDFTKQLCDTLNLLDSDRANVIQKKLGIKITDSPFGYNGIITDKNLDCEEDDEKKVYLLINRFLHQNRVISHNQDIADALNVLIGAFPEFINIIGKKQHRTHKYSVDMHTLKVLRYTLLDEDYKKLNEKEKMCIKLTVLFHDFGKDEGQVDEGHPQKSAEIAADILSELNFNNENKSYIDKMIKNHHWFKRANTTESIETLKEIADKFRDGNDLIIAKIIAEADVKSVNEIFAQKVGVDKLPLLVEKLEELQN